MQPAPLLNSKGNLATSEFPNEDSNPMEASRSLEASRLLEASFSEDSLMSSEKSNPSSTSNPIDLRFLYDNKFALLYKEDEELNDPAFQARKREEKKRAQEIAAAPLRDYCMQVKRQLEAECNGNMSGHLEIEIPEKIRQGSKKSQPGMGAFTTPNRKLAENRANPHREINGKTGKSPHQTSYQKQGPPMIGYFFAFKRAILISVRLKDVQVLKNLIIPFTLSDFFN